MIPYSFTQKWKARHFGKCFLRKEKRSGWTGKLPLFLAYCKKHGFYESYPHGHSQILVCPRCLPHDKIIPEISSENIYEYELENLLTIKV